MMCGAPSATQPATAEIQAIADQAACHMVSVCQLIREGRVLFSEGPSFGVDHLRGTCKGQRPLLLGEALRQAGGCAHLLGSPGGAGQGVAPRLLALTPLRSAWVRVRTGGRQRSREIRLRSEHPPAGAPASPGLLPHPDPEGWGPHLPADPGPSVPLSHSPALLYPGHKWNT
nr:uncharacterized protein LOC108403064 isoform X1 [Manis javanica]